MQVSQLEQVKQNYSNQPKIEINDQILKCRKIIFPNNVKRPIGLYIRHQIPALVPLKTNDFSIKIIDSIAQTTIKQTYKNDFDNLLEAEFCFPLDNNVVVEKLICEFDGKKIEGIIKEKQQAKKEYQENKEIGNTVVYGEKSEDTPDIMKIQIGNILPATEVVVTFVYTEELGVVQNKFLSYRLPQNITPRYDNSQDDQINQNKNQDNYQQIQNQKSRKIPVNHNYNNFKKYTTKIDFEIITQNPIKFMESSTHSLLINYQNDTKTEMKGMVDLSNSNNNFSEGVNAKDLVLLIKQDEIQVPKAQLCLNEKKDQYCAKITFVPDFNNAELDDAYKSYLSECRYNNFDVDLEAARSEFIFLLDRSGSMSGSRIEKAKQALILFLQSLPPQCYFNVVSFGSRYESMFEKSVQYTQFNLEYAVENIEIFGANLGGTIIHSPLQEIFKKPLVKNYPRQIFLLTDGCVSSPQDVISLIQRNNKKARVHSIGIGSGASTYLVNECAKKGNGKPIFVGDNEDVSGHIISLLDVAMTPCLDDFSLHYDKNIVDSIIPAPESIPMIIKNEAFTMYMYFKKEAKIDDIIKSQVQLKCFDSKINKIIAYSVEIKELQENLKNMASSMYKMGVHKQIQCLEDNIRFGQNENTDIYFAQKLGNKEQIQQLSIENQIISTETAYLCVVNEPEDEKRGEILNKKEIKFIVPQIVNENQNQNKQQQQQFMCKKKSVVNKSKKKSMNYSQDNSLSVTNIKLSIPQNTNSVLQNRTRSSRQSAQIPTIQKQQQQQQLYQLYKQEENEYEDDDEDDNIIKLDSCIKRPMSSINKNLACNNSIQNNSKVQESKKGGQKNSRDELTYKLQKNKKEEKETKVNQEITLSLIEILKQQQFQGNWIFKDNLVKQITGQNMDSLLPILTQFEHQQKNDILMTIMIMIWLDKKQQQEQNSWKLIYKKSQNWLKQQKLNNLEEIQQSVSMFI